jgi:PAS domain S-box-containing protein
MVRGNKASTTLLKPRTKPKQVENALRESEERYRAVIEGAHDMIQSVALDGRIIFVNRAWLDTLGYTSAELPSLNLAQIIHPDSLAHCQELFARVLKGEAVHDVEASFLTKDGRKILVEGNAAPRYAGGKIIATQGIFHDITERKRAEQALADEVTRRRILIDQSLDGIVVLDEEARVVEANQRFAEMLGYTPEEVHKLHTWDWDKNFPPEKLLEMGRAVDEKGLHLETKHHRKDGSVIDVDISINGTVIAGQKLIFCVCRDITERKQAEEALQTEKNKLESLIGAMEYTLTIQDKDYNIIYQNEASIIASGGDRLGEKCYRAYEGRDKVCEGCPVEQAFKDGKSHTVERKRVAPSGEVTFWENTASPIRDARGEIVSCLELARDITERKRAEKALEESQRYSYSLLESSPNPISVFNPDLSIRYANPAFEKLTGFNLAEIASMKVPFPWWTEGKSEQIIAGLKNSMEHGGRRSGTEWNFRKKNGERFWVTVKSAPVMQEGKPVYLVINWLDITERRRAEEELKAAQERLIRSEKLAAIGQLASGVGHELRNPLGAIKTAVQYVRRKVAASELPASEPKALEFLGLIDEEVDRANKVITDLLSFSRVAKPTVSLVKVESIIADALNHVAVPGNVNLVTDVSPELPLVMVDAGQIQQVFVNVILNALEAMPEGGRLEIRGSSKDDFVTVECTDTGSGIPEAVVGKIFEPLFTTKAKGIGLGLAMSKNIMERHGGDIGVQSKEGKGTTFTLSLPTRAA